jgi:DNA-binding HxlR family transcriptional regulator
LFTTLDPSLASESGGSNRIDWTAAGAAVRTVCGKWVIPVIAALASGPRTHAELHRAVGPSISQKVLTETLRRMQAASLITRDATPPAETGFYALTDAGRAVFGPLAAMAAWHRGTINPRR